MGIEDDIRKALRADKRPSHEVGEAAGLHPVAIRRFKAGKKRGGLSIDSLEKLARALKLKIVVKK